MKEPKARQLFSLRKVKAIPKSGYTSGDVLRMSPERLAEKWPEIWEQFKGKRRPHESGEK